MIWFMMRSASLVFNDYYKMGNEERYPIFNNRWGVLWEDLKINSGILALFQLLFVVRRFLFAALVVLPRAYTEIQSIYLFQYFGVVYLSLLMCSYLVAKKPFIKPELNKIELFNELCYLEISILMMTLAYSNEDLRTDPMIKNTVGMMIMYFSLFLFGINVLFVGLDLYKSSIMNHRRKSVRSREYARIDDLMKRAVKQAKEKTKFDKEGKEIPKLDIAVVV